MAELGLGHMAVVVSGTIKHESRNVFRFSSKLSKKDRAFSLLKTIFNDSLTLFLINYKPFSDNLKEAVYADVI